MVDTKVNRWSEAEILTLISEYTKMLRDSGEAPWGFAEVLTKHLPGRNSESIRAKRNYLVQTGRIRRCRDRVKYNLRLLQPTEAAWLAALLDGEGSIRKPQELKRNSTNGASNGLVFTVVACYNTDEGIIEKALTLLPHAKLYSRFPQGPRGKKIIHAINIHGMIPIRDYLEAVLPYMAHTEKIKNANVNLEIIREKLRG